ncbi:MAG: helix-hairpin-helix domain-containing protein [Bacteroidota bacterium]
MKIRQLRSQLTFNRSQRAGIIFLITTVLVIGYVQFFVSFSEEPALDLSSEEITGLQCDMDSLRIAKLEALKPKRYRFNPNFLTDYRAYTLGISPEAYDRLQKFRSEEKWINSAADFKRVTQIPDSLLDVISPLFKFPDWVNKPRSKKNYYHKTTIPFAGEKQDLNTASEDQLKEIRGIGEVLSKRIVKRRTQLGSFNHGFQLYDVWGLSPEVVERVLLRFEVMEVVSIHKMNINDCSASDLATLPGVTFQKAKEIWEFVRLREGVEDLSELLKIEGVTPRKLQVFELYLFAE